ncbi:MAG: cellulose synthase family protein [Chloroherpetonaceae bacterium]
MDTLLSELADLFIYSALALYALSMAVILVFSLGQVHLLFQYFKSRQSSKPEPPSLSDEELPFVTVQLPIYNELYVAERLLRAVGDFDYPKDKFEIHVLDDSTDETTEILARAVEALRANGIRVERFHRSERHGFKAGALNDALAKANGDFIAIFDADFIPPKRFLRETIPHFFTDEKIGVVQTRWAHLNESESLLTQIQALSLNAHFLIEQEGRNSAGYFINFNGTAGVIRKRMIEDAGGWEADTLTEDLDLSYRAQLKGWKFKFLPDLTTPAELPSEMAAFRSQQFRWAKGAIQTAVKHFAKVWESQQPDAVKFHATMHLCANIVFLFVLISGLLSVPLVFYKNEHLQLELYFNLLAVSMLSFFCTISFYATSLLVCSEEHGKDVFGKLLTIFPAFIAFSMGMSLHNSIAVIEGLTGKRSPFVRTPKFGNHTQGAAWLYKKYATEKLAPLTLVEGALSLYFLVGILISLDFGEVSLLPFHCLFATGFGMTFWYSVYHTKILPSKERYAKWAKGFLRRTSSARSI